MTESCQRHGPDQQIQWPPTGYRARSEFGPTATLGKLIRRPAPAITAFRAPSVIMFVLLDRFLRTDRPNAMPARAVRLDIPPGRIHVGFDPPRERALLQQARQLQRALQPLHALTQTRVPRNASPRTRDLPDTRNTES